MFYFGNSTSNTQVTTTDLLLARNDPRNFLNPAPIKFDFDCNRDQRVNVTDVLLARNNATNFLTALKLIDLSGEGAGERTQFSQPAGAAASWLHESDPASTSARRPEKSDSAAEAVDKLLLAYWP